MTDITGFHHISAFTKSAKINHRFYTQLMGLRFVKNTVNQENTSMRHLFYGDYQGTPGSLLTFFEINTAGRTYLENNYFSTVSLKIPSGSAGYWKTRLESFDVSVDGSNKDLQFSDPDFLPLALVEVDESISKENATRHSDIPCEKQIIGIKSVEIYTEAPEKEREFLKNWLNLSTTPTAEDSPPRPEVQLHLKQSASTKPTRLGKGAIDHIALSVSSKEVLNELEKKANKHHYTVEKLIDRGYFSSLYVQDPFSLRFEIATLTPGFTLDEPVESLGDTLALPHFLEPERQKILNQLEENKL